jgi:hypothetical protein
VSRPFHAPQRPSAQSLAYYEALDKAHTQNDYQDFLQLAMAAEIKAFNTVLSLLG